MSSPLYEPLDPARSEIRLLEIISDDPRQAHVVCQLHTVSLEDKPTFTALSYLWGDSSMREPVSVNGHMIHITLNLSHALRHVRELWQAQYPDRDVCQFRLWADAISINQDDEVERNHQVPLMRDIYPSAEIVLSWLGCGTNWMDLAFEMVLIISQEIIRGIGSDVDYWDRTGHGGRRENLSWLAKYPHFCKWEDDAFLNPSAWTSLQRLSQHEYWNRVWIFQELLLARENIILCHGTRYIRFWNFFLVMTWFQHVKAMVWVDRNPLQKPDFIDYSLFNLFRSGLLNSLKIYLVWTFKPKIFSAKNEVKRASPSSETGRSLLELSELLKASDPRDLVYALLGVLDCPIVVDYSKSIAEVYIDFTKTALEDTTSLTTDWLRTAGIGLWENDQKPYSWVPNIDKISSLTLQSFFIGTGHSDEPLLDSEIQRPMIHNEKLYITSVIGSTISDVENVLDKETNGFKALYSFACNFVMRHSPIHEGTGTHPLQAIMALFWTAWNFAKLENQPAYQRLEIGLRFTYYLTSFETDGTGIETHLSGLGLKLENVLESVMEAFLKEPDELDMNEANDIAREVASSLGPEADYSGEEVYEMICNVRQLFSVAENDDGGIGLVPRGTQSGDMICIVQGCGIVLVIRKVENHYVLIGPCSFLGMAEEGHFKRMLDAGVARRERIEIW